MISQTIALFRARRDPALAARIASEMVMDGTIERIGAPILILKLWLSLALMVLAIISALIIWGATASHDYVALLAVPFAAIAWVIVKIWRGIDRGRERVTDLAKEKVSLGLDKVLPLEPDVMAENEETSSQ